MSTTVVIGAQWGDEAKGKLVDYLGCQADVVVRYSGGNNAGHTVITGGIEYRFHLLPVGVLHTHTLSVLASGMVINPNELIKELEETKAKCANLGKLVISPSAHVVLPYHILLDQLEEESRGASKIGTTVRGIGPAYQDKTARIGIRMGELIHPGLFSSRLKEVLHQKNQLLKIYGHDPLDYDAILEEFQAYGEILAPYVADTDPIIQNAVEAGQKILFEGAQGAFLDVDAGTYPYVTSSHPTAAGACLGTGIGPRSINNVLGVCKAYTTRVGGGPFPTELLDAVGDQIREAGHEYGTTTGRPRRCGWQDLVLLRQSCRMNSISGLVVTRLDVLSGLKEVKAAVEYRSSRGTQDSVPMNLYDFEGLEPAYETFAGWDEDIRSVRRFEDLPSSAQAYLRAIKSFTKTPIAVVSVGPDRDETIMVKPNLIWG